MEKHTSLVQTINLIKEKYDAFANEIKYDFFDLAY